jgi:hypothetical protein
MKEKYQLHQNYQNKQECQEKYWVTQAGEKVCITDMVEALQIAIDENDTPAIMLLRDLLTKLGAEDNYPELFL